MNRNIEKRINFTVVTYDVYLGEFYATAEFTVWRKISMTMAKRICKQRDDSYIPSTVKIRHYTAIYSISIDAFVKHANQLSIIQNDTAKEAGQK